LPSSSASASASSAVLSAATVAGLLMRAALDSAAASKPFLNSWASADHSDSMAVCKAG
jgi:hypothetical protein